MIWMARVLGYESLFFTATLMCNQAFSNVSTAEMGRRGFGAAYPEIVDVRPLDRSMVTDQALGRHFYLEPDGSNSKADLRSRRKRNDVAEAWVHVMRKDGRHVLRDPPGVIASESSDTDPNHRARDTKPLISAAERPCNFSIARWTLQCDGHISSQQSNWHKCGLPACGIARGGAT